MRRALAALAAPLLSLSLASPAGAAENAPSSDQLAGVQKRANEAAAKVAEAQSALARVEDEVAAVNRRVAATRGRLAQLRSEVRQLAVRQYVQGGDPTVWIVQSDLGETSRGRALLRHVTLGRTDLIDDFQAASADLREGQEDLERRLSQHRKAVDDLRADEATVMSQLEELAAAQRAYEAKAAADQAAADQAAAAAAARQAAPPPPQGPAPPPRAGAASVQVRAPGLPLRGGPAVIGSGSWICPVQGPRAFTNDWGQPRSGGRRHQGNDILSPRGTPVVASVSGTVSPHNSGMGGISYYLRGDDGNTYFGTHLDSLSGASGRVSAGTVIGRVGNSGNARGGPTHLHFEIHPGGRGPVNPYPTLSRYC